MPTKAYYTLAVRLKKKKGGSNAKSGLYHSMGQHILQKTVGLDFLGPNVKVVAYTDRILKPASNNRSDLKSSNANTEVAAYAIAWDFTENHFAENCRFGFSWTQCKSCSLYREDQY